MSELISRREHTGGCFDEYSLIGEVSSDLAHVTLKPNESQDSLLRRFRKKVTRERILSDVKKKRFFIKKSEERRRALRKAVRKQKQRTRRARRRRY
jgi:small subunit ribosomal protein S21